MEIKLDREELEALSEARLQLQKANNHENLHDNTLICECMCITLGHIREYYNKGNIDFVDLAKEFGLGTGCSNCLKDKDFWMDKIKINT